MHKYKPDLYETLSKELSDNRCAVRLRDKSSFVCRVLKVEKGYLICEKEGTDTAIQRIPVHLIDCYVVISEDCYKFDDEFTHRIKGYKAVELVDGVLGTDKFIYEMGIPYTQEKEDPFDSYYESTYSHFCTKIEDVLGWRERLLSAGSEYRLFEVEATGHCFQNTPNGWVSNHLTLKREISQEEILEYFENRSKMYGQRIAQEILEGYRTAHIEPYRNDLRRPEIIKMYRDIINMRLKREANTNFDKWLYEQGFHHLKKSYCYLSLRSDIHEGCFSKESEEYIYLVESKCNPELEAIARLIKYKDQWVTQ